MRVAICPKAIIFTETESTVASTMAKGAYCGLSTCDVFVRCFLSLRPNYILYLLFMHLNLTTVQELTRGEYCNRITPHPPIIPSPFQ